MYNFKYYRNNNQRYNIYESYFESETRKKSYYQPIRNALAIIAILLSFGITSLIAYDTYYQEKKTKVILNNSSSLTLNDEKIEKIVESTVISELQKGNHLDSISQEQLVQIVNNVLNKVTHTPNQVIYTNSKD